MDALFGDADFETSKEATALIGKIIAAHNLQNSLLYDLGSCWGGFVFGIQTACPGLQIVGVDKSRIKTWLARLRSLYHRNQNFPRFLKADIFDVDVSKIDLAFVYLPRPLLPALEAKLQKDLKPGSLAITYRVNFPTWRPTQIFVTDLKRRERNNIFIYKKINKILTFDKLEFRK
ncbi:MAG: hypothetical protein HYV13_03035 [Candidatus Doudnabacteria bacterium]|nr:hypothetical protein [Candidatus Doudnabacteria bacterium]